MIASRKSTVTHGVFFKTRTLDKLIVEGAFHPIDDLILTETDDYSAHFKIKGHEEGWGVTFPKGKTLVEARQADIIFGYFHIHKRERVYVNAVLGDDEGNSLVPCYECGVAIKGKW